MRQQSQQENLLQEAVFHPKQAGKKLKVASRRTGTVRELRVAEEQVGSEIVNEELGDDLSEEMTRTGKHHSGDDAEENGSGSVNDVVEEKSVAGVASVDGGSD